MNGSGTDPATFWRAVSLTSLAGVLVLMSIGIGRHGLSVTLETHGSALLVVLLANLVALGVVGKVSVK